MRFYKTNKGYVRVGSPWRYFERHNNFIDFVEVNIPTHQYPDEEYRPKEPYGTITADQLRGLIQEIILEYERQIKAHKKVLQLMRMKDK